LALDSIGWRYAGAVPNAHKSTGSVILYSSDSREANPVTDTNKTKSFRFIRGAFAIPIFGESKMQLSKINSAIAETLPAVESINGVAIATVEETIKEIGFASQKESAKIVKSKDELARLNANLLGWIAQLDAEGKVMRFPDDHKLTPKKVIPIKYDDFMIIRGFYVGAAYDAGAVSIDAAEKVWEAAIKELATEAGYTRPKSDDKDAVRMAENRVKLIEKHAPDSDAVLIEKKEAALKKGDNKSVSLVKEINNELARREKPELDKAQKARAVTRDAIIARAKELCKAGTDDADELLIAGLLAMTK
jgi:hypothetical protein